MIEHAADGPLPTPTNSNQAAATIADVFFTVNDHQVAGRHEDVVAGAARLVNFTTPGNRSSTRLLAIRLAAVDALMRLGRGTEARDRLDFVERFNGRSFHSRQLAARLAMLFGDPAGAADALEEAMMGLPLEAKPGKLFRKLVSERAEALVLCGRAEEGRDLLLAGLGNAVPGYDELATLRRACAVFGGPEALFRVAAPMFSYPGHRSRSALFQYSIAARDAGRMDMAIAAARQRFLHGLQIVKYGGKGMPDKTSWTGDATRALLDLRHDLTALGLDFFLVSGTFLGAHRDNAIIGHDKDIDVGVMTEMPADAIRNGLGRTGRFTVKQLQTDRLVQIRHANGVMIDVFLHWREGDRILHEGLKAQWWNSDFGLVETEFLGERFLVPDNPETYLAENYGPGWRTPEPDFETFVDTPNMIVQDQGHMTWYFYTKLHDYYYLGRPLQFRKVWEALKSRIDEDGAVESAVARILTEAEVMERLAIREAAEDGADQDETEDAE